MTELTDQKIVLFKMNNLRKYQFLVYFEFEVKKADKKLILLNLFRFSIWYLKLLLVKCHYR